MALLIGARLGQHALSTSPADPKTHLPDLFGRISGIERVNRTVEDAAQLLEDAEHHLASMGIPYILGVQAAFLSDAIEMLRNDGKDDPGDTWTIAWRPDPNDIHLSELHEYIGERCGQPLPAELLDPFHLIRRIRNRITHFAGEAGSRLPGEYKALRRDSKAKWETITGRPLSIGPTGRLELAEGELVATLAITRALARVVNESLAQTISRESWAKIVVADYRSLEPQRFGERPKQLRRVRGHARLFYGSLRLTEDELADALES
jgi:hypothetical protein